MAGSCYGHCMSSVTQGRPKTAPSEASRRGILVDSGLFVNDPASYPGLADVMDPSTGIDLEFQPVAYDTRNSTRMKVPCSICPQKQAHFDGAIVRLKDKKVGLVGNDCGKRHFFGDDGWVSLQNRMRVNEDRAVFLARFGPAKDRIDALEPLLTRWSRKFRGRNTRNSGDAIPNRHQRNYEDSNYLLRPQNGMYRLPNFLSCASAAKSLASDSVTTLNWRAERRHCATAMWFAQLRCRAGGRGL